MRTKLHEDLINKVIRLPKDYEPFGSVKRWEDPNKSYPDCSIVTGKQIGRAHV